MEHRTKNHIRLPNNTVVPEYVKSFKLPILTHCPHKWAMIDVNGSNIYMIDPAEPPDTAVWMKALNKADLLMLKQIITERLKHLS